MTSARGRVVLVGAGPGAADLLTVRGQNELAQADVVVHDALVSEEVLALAPAHAERIDVGRRGHLARARTQEDIDALLVERARQGKRVVRLKGGDPFVFGRGGEEMTACRDAGVPVEVVPGISSALAGPAAAGVPVTDRRFATSFAVVTGHMDPTRTRAETDWAALGRSVDTLVVLMGMRNLGAIAERLIEAGLAAERPALVAMNATRSDERVVQAPLGAIADEAARAGLGSPAVLVVGDVVALRDDAWRDALPLLGLRVLVTREPRGAEDWCRALRSAGAEPHAVAMIEIEPLPAAPGLGAAVYGLDRYDGLLFTSANGVRAWASLVAEAGIDMAMAPDAACVGPATARAAREAGLRVRTQARRTDAGGLLEAILAQGPVADRRYLLAGAERMRGELARGLREAGAAVDVQPVYRTRAASFDAEALRDALVQGAFDALTFASPSAVRSFVAALDPEARAACTKMRVVAIGPITAEALVEAGLQVDDELAAAGTGELVAALARGRPAEKTGGEEKR